MGGSSHVPGSFSRFLSILFLHGSVVGWLVGVSRHWCAVVDVMVPSAAPWVLCAHTGCDRCSLECPPVPQLPCAEVSCPACESRFEGGSNGECCCLQAMKYLSYVLYPLCIGGAVYSLLNVKYKRYGATLTWIARSASMCSAESWGLHRSRGFGSDVKAAPELETPLWGGGARPALPLCPEPWPRREASTHSTASR